MRKAVEITSQNHILRGYLHKPDTDKKKIPTVIIFHGFMGNKMGPHFIFVKLSKLLEERGIASIRFDFGGSGESDGDFANMTLSKELKDANEIFKYVKSLDFVDQDNIGVLGLSMGGAIASMIAGEHKDCVKSLCLWAPAGNMGEVTLDYFIRNRKEELIAQGHLDVEGFVIGKAFVEDVTNLDIYNKAAGFDRNILIIHGDRDDVVPLKASEIYKKLYGHNANLHVIRGADHTFDKKEWEDNVLSLSVEFLEKELAETIQLQSVV